MCICFHTIFPSCSNPRDWIEFLVLYSGTLLLIHFKCNSLYLISLSDRGSSVSFYLRSFLPFHIWGIVCMPRSCTDLFLIIPLRMGPDKGYCDEVVYCCNLYHLLYRFLLWNIVLLNFLLPNQENTSH